MIKNHGPWTITETILKYKNKWIQVTEDRVIRPDGQPGIFGIVTMNPGVSVLPVDEQGYVYLTKEFHYALGKESIEVVSGAIDSGEKDIDAAQRELQEELGILADDWVNLGTVHPFTTVINSPAELFLARKLKFTHQNLEGTEVLSLYKVKLEEALNMVLESKITHGPSCVLILKAKIYLKKK